MKAIIGIDLGTTYSAVATMDETGRPVIVHNADGANITPSCVVESSEGVMEVGEFARRQWGNAPETAAARFKRDMGTSSVQKINGKSFTPTQLSAFVLRKLMKDAQAALGPIAEAVITIPANFAHEAREATMAAAKAANINVNFIINEPTAAALYYAFKQGEELHGTYAVYDLGGGTFDVSIINVNGHNVEVLATNGVSKLGGDDFDSALQKLVQRKFKEQTGRDLELQEFTKNDAEDEKKALSKRPKVTTRVGRALIDLRREEFEEAISSLVTQAEMLCEATIDDAGLNVKDIRGVFLVGGSTRVPMVQESVRRVFQKEPTATANVDEVVALGAALYAAYKSDRSVLTPVQRRSIDKIIISETTSKCFGTISFSRNDARNEQRLANATLIRKGDRIPCSVTESFYTVAEGQKNVNCQVTESTAVETDPRFVKIIWEGKLELPPDRPAEQEIKITYAYDENQIMKCSFVDVATSRETKIDLSMASSNASASDVHKFLVE